MTDEKKFPLVANDLPIVVHTAIEVTTDPDGVMQWVNLRTDLPPAVTVVKPPNPDDPDFCDFGSDCDFSD
jgi:hypothetical protein